MVFVALAEGIAACEMLETRVRAGVLWRPVLFPYHPHVTVAHDLPPDVLDTALEDLAGYEADVHRRPVRRLRAPRRRVGAGT